ncbi:MAG: YjbH domain-containing protein [Melioribacteraceae bacterium]|nr:YjbH domain-containing protein [Melioribacteraceae bacterium]
MKLFKISFYYFFITVSVLFSQNLEGLSGLFIIPTADLNNDGVVTTGVSFVNKEIVSFGGFGEDAVTPYLTINYLPFAEFSIRITRLINSEITTQGIGDRTISARIRFLEESKNIPSIVLGLHDLVSVYGGSSAVHNNALYVVASKHLSINYLLNDISFHLGYGTDLMKAQTHNFLGLFGGLSLTVFKALELMFEYDTKSFNSGCRLTLFNQFRLIGGFIDNKYFSGGVSFSFIL